MNLLMIVYIIGWIMVFEAVMFLVPIITSLIYMESQGLGYLITMVVEAVIGYLMIRKKPEKTAFYAKEGFVTVGLCWVIFSVFGALPFVITKEIPNYIDALFETVSGFTTTGASILTNVEGLCQCNLMWRSFTHWVGGMGFLVFVMAILPMTGGSSMYLLRAESPGPSVGKLAPKMKDTAMVLYGIYLAMTVFEMALLVAFRMPVFDAITTSFGTAGTGGFGIKNSSIASYSVACKWIIAVFMMLFGVNFNLYYLILMKKGKEAIKSEELRWYLLIVIGATAFITLNIMYRYNANHVHLAVTDAYFQVSSIMTTTGFATTDFNMWPQQSKTILVLLMFIGASAGSTGGGIKVSRIIILIKTIPKEIGYYLHPHSVRKVHLEGHPLEHETVRSTSVFLSIYVLIFAFSVFLISFDKVDMVSSFTSVAATINNIGPGLELVGPTGNYAFYTPISKLVLIFDMLAGRLELIPMLLLFSPGIWKSAHRSKRLRNIQKAKKLKEKKHVTE